MVYAIGGSAGRSSLRCGDADTAIAGIPDDL
jgi:hypothetical protein